MRTRGAGAQIPFEYRGVTSPFVGVHVIYRPHQHVAELAAYTYYLAKDGAGEDGGPGEHFTRDGQQPDRSAFLKRVWKAPWCFKVIVSPTTETGTRLPLQDFARSWMQAVEQDLGVKLNWVAGAHYATDQPHVQLIWSRRTLAGEPVRTDREYIGHGLRARAAEMVDLYS